MTAGAHAMFVEMAKQNGKINDPNVRQALMRLHTLSEIGRVVGLHYATISRLIKALETTS